MPKPTVKRKCILTVDAMWCSLPSPYCNIKNHHQRRRRKILLFCDMYIFFFSGIFAAQFFLSYRLAKSSVYVYSGESTFLVLTACFASRFFLIEIYDLFCRLHGYFRLVSIRHTQTHTQPTHVIQWIMLLC